MNINKSVEQADGTYIFQGTIEGRELDFLIEYALNDLARKGALPYASTQSVNPASLMAGTNEEQ